MDDAFIRKVLATFAIHYAWEELFWSEDLASFFVICDDFFFWGCGDSEDITPDNFYLLEPAFDDAEHIWGPLLFCARSRGMRPQGAYYKSIPKDMWPLFDACGPERDVDFTNPKQQGN